MNFSEKQNKCLKKAWVILLVTYSVLFIVVGIDKFFNVLVDWQSFIGESIQNVLPFSSLLIIRLFALVQIIAGLFLLYSRSRYAIYCILLLLTFIFFSVGSITRVSVVMVHDICMLIHCIVLLWLTDVVNSLTV